jgi:hypothetical protein
MIDKNESLLGKNEWNQMPQVHCLGGWAPTCVKVKWFSLLNLIQDDVQISVRKEDAATKEMVN